MGSQIFKPTSAILLGMGLLVGCHQGRLPTASELPTTQAGPIQCFADRATAGKGLLVEIVEPVEMRPGQRVPVKYSITSLLEEEVFVRVPDGQEIGCDFARDDGLAWGTPRMAFHGLDNLVSLRQLLPSHYVRGERRTCNCCEAVVNAMIALPNQDLSAGKATALVYVRGIRRADGTDFAEVVRVPLSFKK